MDFLKSQIARLQAQFEQLTASQKMLSVSLVAIMVMTLLWWGRYAGTAEMEAVIDRDFTSDDIARITGELQARGIAVSNANGRVLVPTDRKSEALGALIYADLLPQDSSSNVLLDMMNKQTNPFSSSQQTEIAYNAAHAAYLGTIIRGFKGVQRANVVIALPRHEGFHEETPAAASVTISLKPGQKCEEHLPVAVANFLTGAVSGLKRKNVRVIVNEITRQVPDDSEEGDGSLGGSDRLHMIAEAELHYSEKIHQLFSSCDNLAASVSIELNDKVSDLHETKFDQKGVISKESETTSETSNNASKSAGGEPGVAPNTQANGQMAISSAGGGDGQTSTTDKQTAKSQIFVPQQESHVHQSAGAFSVSAATVLFPRSYFVKAYLNEMRTDKEPTEAILDTFIKSKCERYRVAVKNVCGNVPEEKVTVDYVPDVLQPVADVPTQAVGGVSLMFSSHLKEIVLGALAVASLFMVSMMVRKSGGPALAAGRANTLVNENAGSTVDALLAKASGKSADAMTEVAEGGQSLDGVELDDEAVRQAQVAEQVSALVKDNPDAAASLIKRWMNRA